MIPVLIDGCTGWLHPPPPGARTTRGVVLCNSLGDEACVLHRPLAMIAAMLARGGLTVLRLDYPGAGDSVQDSNAEIMPDDMIAAIAAAASWLREEAGLAELALCGIRAGALLAALASQRIRDFWGLALLAPPPSGRAFVRETLMKARAWDAMWLVEDTTERDGWFEAQGLRLTLAAKRTFEALDLRRLDAASIPRVLVIEPEMARNPGALAARLRDGGAEATECPFGGYEPLLRDALENRVPQAEAAALCSWLSAGAHRDEGAEPHVAPAAPYHVGSGAIERVVTFGAGDTLAGVLTMPADGAPQLGALIVNTGAHPHTGHGRFPVTLARTLARSGVATLRMDASGLGDAAISTGHRSDVYSAEHVSDARAGFHWLQRATGCKVMAIGMCSGAYTALRLCDEPQLAGLVMVNLQRMFFDPGVPLRVVQNATKRTTRFYMSNIGRPETWRRIVTGDIDAAGISRALAGRALRRARSAADPLLARVGVRSRYAEVRGWFASLARRGVPVAYMLSGNDPGWDELEEYFGAGGARLRRMPNVILHRLENADHTLSHPRPREELCAVIAQVIAKVPATAPAPPPAVPEVHAIAA